MRSKKNKNYSQLGFTLIELLVVISIMNFISSLFIVHISEVRLKGKVARAEADLHQLRIAVEFLLDDTGNWPNGCPPGFTAEQETRLDANTAGIRIVPPVGVTDPPCAWTAEEVAKWKGPYVKKNVIMDPWGKSYYFDADYNIYGGSAQDDLAILSKGPDNLYYTPDDIVIWLE